MQYQGVIVAALKDLGTAADGLKRGTFPATPLPRPKIIHFVGRYSWPKLYDLHHGGVCFLTISSGEAFSDTMPLIHSTRERLRLAENIITECKHQPRLILRTLRRIQAATAWCETRTEGRNRAAAEILRQQSAAVEALEAEATMLALK